MPLRVEMEMERNTPPPPSAESSEENYHKQCGVRYEGGEHRVTEAEGDGRGQTNLVSRGYGVVAHPARGDMCPTGG